MRATCCGLLLAVTWLTGCGDPAAGCPAPEDAVRSVAPYDHGVALYAVFEDGDRTTAQIWACNESGQDRHLLQRAGECKGSWTWTFQADGAQQATSSWPEVGHYGDCSFETLPDGHHEHRTFTLPEGTGAGEWRIRLQVYMQPEIITDAGGGPVEVVHRVGT